MDSLAALVMRRDQTFLFDQTTVGYGGAFYDFAPSSPDRLLEYYVSQKDQG
jgi:hypothetical protein